MYRSSLAADNVLIRDEVHAIPGGSNHSHISNRVQRYLLVQRDGPLHPDDGLVAAAAELLVDTLHQAQHKGMQLSDVLAA